MLLSSNAISYFIFFNIICGNVTESKRQRRYLIFPPSTQYGVFVTVSIALPEPENLVNVAWFIEANYYNVANSTYLQPLLGDIFDARSRRGRDANERQDILTRHLLYTFIEAMLKRHGYPGRACLLRLICETATSHFSHNGVIGDLMHLILTPSASIEEGELRDSYYEAEYNGLDGNCGYYFKKCPSNPFDDNLMYIDHLL